MTAVIVICIALWLSVLLLTWLIAPSIKSREITCLKGTLIAHRGLHDDPRIAENSLGAFRLAVEMGLPIELDVHLTKDLVPIVIHDETLSRVCGIDKRVGELSISEIGEYPLSANGESVPALSRVLETVDGRVPLLIELKGSAKSPIAEKTGEILKDYRGAFVIQSFEPEHLRSFRKTAPDVPLGILAERRNKRGRGFSFGGFLAENLMYNFICRPDFISYKYSDQLPLTVRLCRRLGTPVFGWTLRDRAAYDEYKNSFDALICEGFDEIRGL